MQKYIRRYRHYLSNKAYAQSFVFSIFLFALSVLANFGAGVYATVRASNYVSDIVLSNIPVFDVDGIFVWGAALLIAFIAALCLSDPRRLPFTLFALALFYFIRAGFVTLTHLGVYPDHAVINEGTLWVKLFGGDDLFFSGHTGAPFLLALLYWREEILRYIFIAWSVVMAVTVLLGHLHYSIDVLSAYFITYTIFHITIWMFPGDYARFHESEFGIP